MNLPGFVRASGSGCARNDTTLPETDNPQVVLRHLAPEACGLVPGTSKAERMLLCRHTACICTAPTDLVNPLGSGEEVAEALRIHRDEPARRS